MVCCSWQHQQSARLKKHDVLLSSVQAYETFPRWDCTRAIRLQKCSTVQWRRPTPEVWVRKPAKCKYFTSVTHRSCCTRLLAKPFAANQKYAGSIAATHDRFSDVDEKWVRPSCVEISTHVKYPQVVQMTLPLCNISCASEQGYTKPQTRLYFQKSVFPRKNNKGKAPLCGFKLLPTK